MDEMKASVRLEQIKDYEFKVTFDDSLPEFLMDEPEPIGTDHGPNASRVLAAAIGHCLTASLLFGMKKMRATTTGLKTTVSATVRRNEQNRLRLSAGHVVISVGIDPEARNKLFRCTDLFEDYCIVTQAVRNGIDISVEVRDDRGEVVYDSREG